MGYNNQLQKKLQNEQRRTLTHTRDDGPTVIFGSSNRGAPHDSAEHKARQTAVSQRGPRGPEEEGGIIDAPKPSLEFQKALQQARTARGFKQADLARTLNLKASQINDWENGKAVPTGLEKARLGKVLGVNFRKPGGGKKAPAKGHA